MDTVTINDLERLKFDLLELGSTEERAVEESITNLLTQGTSALLSMICIK